MQAANKDDFKNIGLSLTGSWHTHPDGIIVNKKIVGTRENTTTSTFGNPPSDLMYNGERLGDVPNAKANCSSSQLRILSKKGLLYFCRSASLSSGVKCLRLAYASMRYMILKYTSTWSASTLFWRCDFLNPLRIYARQLIKVTFVVLFKCSGVVG